MCRSHHRYVAARQSYREEQYVGRNLAVETNPKGTIIRVSSAKITRLTRNELDSDQFEGRRSKPKGHPPMMKFFLLWLKLFADFLSFLVLSLRSKSSLAAENLFLRKQLAFYQERKIRSRRIDNSTRLMLVWLSRWFDWRSALAVVTPKTFIGWHRKGFQLFWRRK
jgi:hypothetical protein